MLVVPVPRAHAYIPENGPGPTWRRTYVGRFRVTVYHTVPEQTDDEPLRTADGTLWEPGQMQRERVCAVSQDMLKHLGGGPLTYETWLWLGIPGLERKRCQVRDTMALEFYNEACDCYLPVERFVDLAVTKGVDKQWHDVPVYVIENGG